MMKTATSLAPQRARVSAHPSIDSAKPYQKRRNLLARLVFESVEINNRAVVVVTLRPDVAPFFVLDCQRRSITLDEAEATGFAHA
jgi:hypothetical protein